MQPVEPPQPPTPDERRRETIPAPPMNQGRALGKTVPGLRWEPEEPNASAKTAPTPRLDERPGKKEGARLAAPAREHRLWARIVVSSTYCIAEPRIPNLPAVLSPAALRRLRGAMFGLARSPQTLRWGPGQGSDPNGVPTPRVVPVPSAKGAAPRTRPRLGDAGSSNGGRLVGPADAVTPVAPPVLEDGAFAETAANDVAANADRGGPAARRRRRERERAMRRSRGARRPLRTPASSRPPAPSYPEPPARTPLPPAAVPVVAVTAGAPSSRPPSTLRPGPESGAEAAVRDLLASLSAPEPPSSTGNPIAPGRAPLATPVPVAELFAAPPFGEAPDRSSLAPPARSSSLPPDLLGVPRAPSLPAISSTARPPAPQARVPSWKLAVAAALAATMALFFAVRIGWLDAPSLRTATPAAEPSGEPAGAEASVEPPAAPAPAPSTTVAAPAVPAAPASQAATSATAPAAPAVPAASTEAGAPPAPSAPPPDQAAAASLHPTRGYLFVTTSQPAAVFVNGVRLGLANERLEAPCGLRNVRLAGPDPAAGLAWLSAGQPVAIPCRASVSVAIELAK